MAKLAACGRVVHGKVDALLLNVKLAGGVLDACGSASDAIKVVLEAHSLNVSTNDFNPRLTADTHLDATSEEFTAMFSTEGQRPDWIVTSPPYGNAFSILVRALGVVRVGVAFKLRLSFLEPTKTRGKWLKDNPPSAVVVLPRATYCGRVCSSTEAWFIWHLASDGVERPGQAFFFDACS
ncbi:unnamed protein product [Ectocarpus sp. CCAP 1310/34]|nr:unnamed protein product [Ectocarpus sp. CCAP 1310/34]